jgi:MtN3 and saliva related transmembrane protein
MNDLSLAEMADPARWSAWRETIGTCAAVLTTVSFIPQAWLTLRTRDVSGISVSMYSVFTLGVALWLLYGVLLQAWPVIIANAVTLALAASILGMRLHFGAPVLRPAVCPVRSDR